MTKRPRFSTKTRRNPKLTRRSDYAQYEYRKSQWQAAHPEATQAEYDCAMQRIAREGGV